MPWTAASKLSVKRLRVEPSLFAFDQFVLPVGDKMIESVKVFCLPGAAQASTLNSLPWGSLAGHILLRWDQKGDIFFSTPVFVQREFDDQTGVDYEIIQGIESMMVPQSLEVVTSQYSGRILEICFQDKLNSTLGTNESFIVEIHLFYSMMEERNND